MREPATSAFPYIKIKSYKTVVTVEPLEKWKTAAKPLQWKASAVTTTNKKGGRFL
jgi:hypothetical protein